RVPFYVTSATIFLAMGLVWFAVHEEFSRPALGSSRRGTFSSLFALVTTPALLALFFVLLMAQFGVRTVQPIVTLYVKEMVGNLPNLATLAGIAFSITGLANVLSAPFLGNRSDRIGYRRVLLICLAGGTLTTLPFTPATNCDITIDVSHHQGNIDWAAVKETGIECVMIKATQGLTQDSRWETNRDGASGQGLLVIPYTFLTTAATAAEQAEF